MIVRVLEAALPPGNGVTTGQLQDLCGMFLALMHMIPVTPEYFMAKQELVLDLHAKAVQVSVESAMLAIEGMPPAAIETAKSAIQLSIKEISVLRLKLIEELKLIRQCPTSHAKIH